jgi:hypothetical protein
MKRQLLPLFALLVLPSIGAAQRGGTRSAAGQHDELFKDDKPAGPTLRSGDLEDKNPLKLLIDKRKDLKLTDAQLSAFKDSEKQLKEKTAPSLHALDSLVHVMQQSSTGNVTQADAGGSARLTLHNVLQTVGETYDGAATAAVATLDPDQEAKAKELLAGLQQDTQKMVMQKMGGGDHP